MLCLLSALRILPPKNVLHFLGYFSSTYSMYTDSKYLYMMELSCIPAPHHELLGFSQLVPHYFPGSQSQRHGIPNAYIKKGKLEHEKLKAYL